MAYLRLVGLIVALLGFVVVGIPVQALAVRRRWQLAQWLPRFFHRTMCRILRLRVHVCGQPSDVVPQLTVANHVSWVDILAISTLGPMSFLAKKEVRAWPIFGTFAVLQRSIFVDRQRVGALPKVNAELAGRMAAGDRIVVFAESTTGNGLELLRFRPTHLGAAELLLATQPALDAVLIQPLAIHYVVGDGHTGVAWYGDMELLPHIWAMLRGGPYECHVGFAAPVLFDRHSSRKGAMAAAHDAVKEMLGGFAHEGDRGRLLHPASLVR